MLRLLRLTYISLFSDLKKKKKEKRSNLFSLTEEEKKDCIPAEIFFKNQ